MASIVLTWNASLDPSTTGYHIWAGRDSRFLGGTYDATGSPKDVGNVTTGTFDLLGNNGVWFFAITAYNDFGDGGFSPELTGSFHEIVPGAAALNGLTPVRLQATFLRPGSVRRIA
jgi:hypothetical protein